MHDNTAQLAATVLIAAHCGKPAWHVCSQPSVCGAAVTVCAWLPGCLSCSGFSPLEGFISQAEYDSVVANMRMTVSRQGGRAGAGWRCAHNQARPGVCSASKCSDGDSCSEETANAASLPCRTGWWACKLSAIHRCGCCRLLLALRPVSCVLMHVYVRRRSGRPAVWAAHRA